MNCKTGKTSSNDIYAKPYTSKAVGHPPFIHSHTLTQRAVYSLLSLYLTILTFVFSPLSFL